MVTAQQIEQAMINADQAMEVLRQIIELLSILLTSRIANTQLPPAVIQSLLSDYSTLKQQLQTLLTQLP